MIHRDNPTEVYDTDFEFTEFHWLKRWFRTLPPPASECHCLIWLENGTNIPSMRLSRSLKFPCRLFSSDPVMMFSLTIVVRNAKCLGRHICADPLPDPTLRVAFMTYRMSHMYAAKDIRAILPQRCDPAVKSKTKFIIERMDEITSKLTDSLHLAVCVD
ncbi:hypothetical protein BDY19DRAFT_448479 [Irpex rosettiformis]|uniref:Uncharacterized protein n=1 Tax=Irpex rosettiformis TaxID=378272 RepID=A0ACB8TU18_9APHY|nr:hypothetical protein BDY19DRAFT_448479 [Irpex rosettiformis]